MKETIKEILQPIADGFSSLGTPEPIVHWGHPVMMGIVIFAMGTFAGITGWKIRTSSETDIIATNKGEHRKVAPLMFLFITMGYSGGILSLIMQGQDIFSSIHFWTGSLVIALLGLNGLISITGFGGDKATLRTAHAYLGSFALLIMFAHAIFGLKLGLSI
jgi:Protein of unknown function (DUF4079)